MSLLFSACDGFDMGNAEPLDIKVIYSSSSRPRKVRRKAAPPPPKEKKPPPPPKAKKSGRSPSSGVLLGFVTLGVAGLLAYVTWWQIDSFLYRTMAMKTPIPGVDLNQVAGMIAPAASSGAPPAAAAPVAPGGLDATASIILAAYSWLTCATIASCVLAFSGGALLGRAGGSALRLVGTLVAVGGAGWLAWEVYRDLTDFGSGYPPNHLRAGWCAFVVVMAFVGLAWGRNVRGLTRLAALALIVSALVTVAGLYVGGQHDALSPERTTSTYMITAFVVHSLYGWILLPISFRIRQ